MTFRNTYEDDGYAAAYARLEFPDTYYLAFRDLPELFARHAADAEVNPSTPPAPVQTAAADEFNASNKPCIGRSALDFGCGAGRSTRFLRGLGYEVIGIDISDEMIRKAKAIDPGGDYRLLADNQTGVPGAKQDDAAASQLPGELIGDAFDVVLSAFPFDNIPTMDEKIATLKALRRVMKPSGVLLNLVSSPEIYWHEWASFTTRDFPENRSARCGDTVRIIVTALDDRRPVEDVICFEADYRQAYAAAGLTIAGIHRPLGRPDQPYRWVNETTIAPWTIYVLKKE